MVRSLEVLYYISMSISLNLLYFMYAHGLLPNSLY